MEAQVVSPHTDQANPPDQGEAVMATVAHVSRQTVVVCRERRAGSALLLALVSATALACDA